ncbi:hypothetical protein Mp_6g08890 [Marchantia polymorpha subsp. ruderalis]|uniref:Uncharacterized protein n=2 Tax=Marchantia polymorpha TaxID=3197 RepID=A0AAF6BQ18_MARPO|nr:hypothetical protein MARPO_0060s0030 [Marchantia polymorpha]BBN14102.1 hypothetical protein Mp_6g08890 [Marchantia polymorpha subsp. ruderalis]|eukprot:PTQ36941.1 hypothetical protein MARPO_0060s0030 [Marchantia polymorpha]
MLPEQEIGEQALSPGRGRSIKFQSTDKRAASAAPLRCLARSPTPGEITVRSHAEQNARSRGSNSNALRSPPPSDHHLPPLLPVVREDEEPCVPSSERDDASANLCQSVLIARRALALASGDPWPCARCGSDSESESLSLGLRPPFIAMGRGELVAVFPTG